MAETKRVADNKRPFAKGTTVDTNASRLEIQKLVKRLNATRFMYGYEDGREIVAFDAYGRRVRFELPIPPDADEKEVMRLWRGLVHRIKSRVISVEDGIAEFEEEFFSNIVLVDGRTIAECVLPELEGIARVEDLMPLLPSPPLRALPGPQLNEMADD